MVVPILPVNEGSAPLPIQLEKEMLTGARREQHLPQPVNLCNFSTLSGNL